MQENDQSQSLLEQVINASQLRQAIHIVGGNSKPFYGNQPPSSHDLATLSCVQHTGIIDYEPSELYITARSGTPLKVIEETLAEQQQMLPFEPASFSHGATIGGTIACGVSGPRRPFSGACRDSILGVDIINGLGQPLSFGGHVMKNVAGYDVSRGMCGSLGTLGLITQVSVKVIPKPDYETTVMLAADFDHALKCLSELRQSTLPMSANYFENEHLYIRFNLSAEELEPLNRRFGAIIHDDTQFWHQVKEQRRPFFSQQEPLWRCSLPIGSPAFTLSGNMVAEWNAGLHWYKTQDSAEHIQQLCQHVGGHAQLFSTEPHEEFLSHPPTAMFNLHKRIKNAFDPHGIFNPNRLFMGL